MIEEKLYENDVHSYRTKLPVVKQKLKEFNPENATLIFTPVSPYSISIVAGIPLFRTHDHQRDFNAVMYDLKGILPGQFPYDTLRTHISLGTIIRNAPGTNTNYTYEPTGDKKEFYSEYLDVFRDLQFNPFSLTIEGLYPPGIILFNPVDNENEIFNIRKQIREGLKEKGEKIYCEKDSGGNPVIDSGIVHSTFLRFADKKELTRNYQQYKGKLHEINCEILEEKLFSDPLVINEISFIEARVSKNISVRDWYSDEVILRKNMDNSRIKSIEEIEIITQELKNKQMKIVTTNGSYDLVHIAHIDLLKKAKELGDILIVLLNSDESIRRNKGPLRPIIPEDERAYLLSELKAVDFVVIFPQDKPLDYLARIKPDVHVKGGSGLPERFREEKEFIEKLGGSYHIFDLQGDYSSSNLIKKIVKLHKD